MYYTIVIDTYKQQITELFKSKNKEKVKQDLIKFYKSDKYFYLSPNILIYHYQDGK